MDRERGKGVYNVEVETSSFGKSYTSNVEAATEGFHSKNSASRDDFYPSGFRTVYLVIRNRLCSRSWAGCFVRTLNVEVWFMCALLVADLQLSVPQVVIWWTGSIELHGLQEMRWFITKNSTYPETWRKYVYRVGEWAGSFDVCSFLYRSVTVSRWKFSKLMVLFQVYFFKIEITKIRNFFPKFKIFGKKSRLMQKKIEYYRFENLKRSEGVSFSRYSRPNWTKGSQILLESRFARFFTHWNRLRRMTNSPEDERKVSNMYCWMAKEHGDSEHEALLHSQKFLSDCFYDFKLCTKDRENTRTLPKWFEECRMTENRWWNVIGHFFVNLYDFWFAYEESRIYPNILEPLLKSSNGQLSWLYVNKWFPSPLETYFWWFWYFYTSHERSRIHPNISETFCKKIE